jgi:hypothetical protein
LPSVRPSFPDSQQRRERPPLNPPERHPVRLSLQPPLMQPLKHPQQARVLHPERPLFLHSLQPPLQPPLRLPQRAPLKRPLGHQQRPTEQQPLQPSFLRPKRPTQRHSHQGLDAVVDSRVKAPAYSGPAKLGYQSYVLILHHHGIIRFFLARTPGLSLRP